VKITDFIKNDLISAKKTFIRAVGRPPLRFYIARSFSDGRYLLRQILC